MSPLVVLFGSLIISLIIRVPISFSLIFASILTMIYDDLSLVVVIQRVLAGLDSYTLVSVPLFLLAGSVMQGEIIDRLLRLSEALIGRIPGALAHVNIVASMFFAGLTGSSVADTAAIGGVLIPAMIKQGYSRQFSVAVTAASSTIGVIIPPSVIMIVYAAHAQISVGAMFLGGAIPGVLVGIGQMIVVKLLDKKYKFPRGTRTYSVIDKLNSLYHALPALFIPIIIVGGIVLGIFTATESAAVAVIYSFIILILYRRINKPQDVIIIIKEALLNIGPTLLCIAGATIFAYLLAYYRLPDYVIEIGLKTNLGYTGALLFVFVLYTILGTFMSGIPTIITFMPIVLAIGNAGGVHPIHLGVVACVTMAVGLITPPYGICLLLACRLANISVMSGFKSVLIFFLFFVIVVIFCIIFPDLVLWLPRLLIPNFS